SPRTERRDQGLGHGVESSGGGWLPHCPRWRHGRWPHWRSEEHVHAQRTTEANPADDGCRTDRGASPAIGAGGRGRARPAAPPAGTSTATAQAAVSSLPAKQDRIRVLTAVLAKMKKNFAQFAGVTPGPVDIFGYNVGALWRQGIDGAGTTIAVMGGWHFLDI